MASSHFTGAWRGSLSMRPPRPTSSEQPLPIGRDRRCGRAPSRHDTTIMAHLQWSATRARLRPGGRLARLSGQPRRSGAHPPLDPLERRPNLFGRLGAPGAPRWADGAVGERRWSGRGVSGCAVSGPTHFTTLCSWERLLQCICACSLHADVTTFVLPRVVPRAVSGHTRSRSF